MPKIYITTVPFGEVDSKPIDLLKTTGWEFIINPLGRKMRPEEVAEFAKDSDGIIAGTEDLLPLIKASNQLKIISRVGIGLDSVPLQLCKDKGIRIAYTPDAVTMAVAELTLGIMVSITRHVNYADMEIRRGNWKRKQGKRIGRSVIGIIGLGRIGTETIKLLAPFNPRKILVNDIKDKTDEISHLKKMTGIDIESVDKKTLYQQADVVTLHVPLSPATKDLIDKKSLGLFKKESYLINLARGGIVNEQDLYDCLKEKKIAGAAIDCFMTEPYNGPLKEIDNVLLTQHMGSCSFDCRAQMEIQAAEDIIRFFNNKPLLNEVPEEEFEYQVL